MQKYIFNLILLLLPVQIFAQKLSFSVVFDPQVTWMNSDTRSVKKDGNQFGFNAGLVMDRYFAENYAFSTGLSIWQTGGKLTLVDTTGFEDPIWLDTLPLGTTTGYKLQYITVPLSLKLKSNQIGYNTFFAHLGVNTYLNVKALASAADMDILNEDIKDEIHLFMVSYFVGGGLEYSLGGETALMTGIYFTNGITDVTRSGNHRVHLGSLALRLGVKF